jgi:uncharacterized Zn-finger protein
MRLNGEIHLQELLAKNKNLKVKRYVPNPGTMMSCSICSEIIERKSLTQKYCSICSEKQDLIRKKLPSEPIESTKSGDKSRASIQRSVDAGITHTVERSEPIYWMSNEIDLLWMVRVSVPFDYAFSKNHILSTTRRGHVYMRQEHKAVRDNLITVFQKTLANQKLVQNKVWVDIYVQKTNHKGDAVNVVDAICDALKKAIGVDDRWFSIRRLDWQIVKDDPKIYIGIGQESDVDCQICSACGRALEYGDFSKNKSTKKGIVRVCKECRSVQRKGKYDN